MEEARNTTAQGLKLLKTSDLKIIMAHVSWPWTHEAIAVAGIGPKFQGNYQIHVDNTPGIHCCGGRT